MLVFVLLLIIVISTSHSCRGNRGGSDTDSGSGSDTNKSPTGSGGAVLPSGDDTSDVEPPAVPSDFVIFIDPGHGPGDVGSSSEYLGEYKERDMTLEVAKEIVRILCDQGYNAKLTHDGVNIPYDPNDSGTFYVDERCDYVNSNNVGLFVSIHCDSYDDEDVYGTRVYYCDDESAFAYRYAGAGDRFHVPRRQKDYKTRLRTERIILCDASRRRAGGAHRDRIHHESK